MIVGDVKQKFVDVHKSIHNKFDDGSVRGYLDDFFTLLNEKAEDHKNFIEKEIPQDVEMKDVSKT